MAVLNLLVENTDSNTTLVKVNSDTLLSSSSKITHSNTTLVKVKFKIR